MDEQTVWQAATTALPTILFSIVWAVAGYWLAPRMAQGRRLWMVLCLAPMMYFLTITLFALLILNAIINRRLLAAKLTTGPAGSLAS